MGRHPILSGQEETSAGHGEVFQINVQEKCRCELRKSEIRSVYHSLFSNLLLFMVTCPSPREQRKGSCMPVLGVKVEPSNGCNLGAHLANGCAFIQCNTAPHSAKTPCQVALAPSSWKRMSGTQIFRTFAAPQTLRTFAAHTLFELSQLTNSTFPWALIWTTSSTLHYIGDVVKHHQWLHLWQVALAPSSWKIIRGTQIFNELSRLTDSTFPWALI